KRADRLHHRVLDHDRCPPGLGSVDADFAAHGGMPLAEVGIDPGRLELDLRHGALVFEPLSEAAVACVRSARRHRVRDGVLVGPRDRRAGLDLELTGAELKGPDLDSRLRRRGGGGACEGQHHRARKADSVFQAHPRPSSIALYYGRGADSDELSGVAWASERGALGGLQAASPENRRALRPRTFCRAPSGSGARRSLSSRTTPNDASM